jgi:hypothetical protein
VSAWNRLVHAYGLATDTPPHLETLDAAAFDHLYSAILHQGSIYPATAAVVEHLCTRPWPPDRAPEVLEFVAHVYRSASAVPQHIDPLSPKRLQRLDQALEHYDEDAFWADEELANDVCVKGLLDVRALAPTAAALAKRTLAAHTDPDRVAPALDLLVHSSLITGAKPEATLNRHAEIGSNFVRQTAIFGLGELHLDTTPFLGDPELGVRVAAALMAPDFEVLHAAALDPKALDAAFEPSPQYFEMWPRFYVIKALCELATSWEAIADAAFACLPLASLHTVEHDWGVFLKVAWPGDTSYLRALVERKDLWDPVYGNAQGVFRDAGLPYDRKACARLVGRRWLRR